MQKLEKRGGGLEPATPVVPPAPKAKASPLSVKRYQNVDVVTYMDTPAKRAYRQIAEGYGTPIFKGQQAPSFGLMRELIRQHDNTEFKDRGLLQVMPEEPPSGKGYMADDRETSHFVHNTLRSINPLLAAAYLDGSGMHDDFERHHHRTDFQYGRTGYRVEKDAKRYQHRLYNIAPKSGLGGRRAQVIVNYPSRSRGRY